MCKRGVKMTKNSNRDDFSQETIRLAGERVGLRCSICGCITKAASEDDNKKVINIGVASHICAAAPKGPRYDPNMTSTERKDISNCIWLCQTHSKLIDVDLKLYTREYLIELKRKAEETARNALRAGKSSFEVIENSGFDIKITKDILFEVINNGEFDKLKNLLNSLSVSNKNEAMQDLYEYVSIVYSFYCDRDNFKQKLENYTSKSFSNYIDNLVELFTIHMNREYLQCVVNACKNGELLKYAQLVLDEKIGNIFVKLSECEKTHDRIVEGSMLHQLATNYAIENNIHEFLNPDGTECHLYVGNFYFQQKVLLYKLGQKVFNLYLVKEQHLSDYDEYNQFNMGLNKIKHIVPEMQQWFWIKLLATADIISDYNIFNMVLSECNEVLRNEVPIKRNILLHKIDTDTDNVKFDDVRKFCEMINDYSLLHFYFSKLLKNNLKLEEVIFNDHRYLLKIESLFLEDYIQLKGEKSETSFSAVEFLVKFAPYYVEDIGFNILLAYYSSKNKKNKKYFSKATSFINEKLNDFTIIPLSLFGKYLHVLVAMKRYATLLKIGSVVMPINLKMTVAKLLCVSKKFKVEVIDLLENIKREYGSIDYLNQLLFECYYNQGDMENSKKCLMEEIDVRPTKENVGSLISIRLETKEIVQDKYFEIAKTIVDSQIYYLIGVTYHELKKNDVAYKYFLKSLLMDDKNSNCLNAMVALGLKEQGNTPSRVCAGVTVRLQSSNKRIEIAIHDESIIDKFIPNKFMGILHFSENDSTIGDLLYRSVGEPVVFKNTGYEIVAITLTSTLIISNAMQTLVSANHFVALRGNSPDDVKNQLVKVLQEQNEHIKDTIGLYNEHQGIVPLSLFAERLGKKMLEAYSFLLFENTERLMNYCNMDEIVDDATYILSMESIYLLALLGIGEENLLRNKCKITLTTKRTMISEANSFIESAENRSSVGQIYLKDEKLYRTEITENDRAEQLRFWNKVKRIVNALPNCEEQYFYDYDNSWCDLFSNAKLQIEGDTIGCLKHNPNYILICDNIFTSQVAIMHNLPIININTFLIALGLDVNIHLQCIQKLAQFNFANYFPANIYKHLKYKILAESANDRRNEYVEQFRKFLTGDFLEEGSDKWKYNNRVIERALLECKINPDTADEFDRILIHAISYNYSKEHPDEFRTIVENIVAGYLNRQSGESEEIINIANKDDDG